jgi:hypothetical protein
MHPQLLPWDFRCQVLPEGHGLWTLFLMRKFQLNPELLLGLRDAEERERGLRPRKGLPGRLS